MMSQFKDFNIPNLSSGEIPEISDVTPTDDPTLLRDNTPCETESLQSDSAFQLK